MFDIVKRLVGATNAGGAVAPKGADNIIIAACALLLEVAAVDGEFSQEEQEAILAILEHDFGVSGSEAADIMEAAQAERAHSIDLWRFTNVINQSYAEADKLRVIDTIWKVIYVDGRLKGHEDHLVHMLAKLLHLTHTQLIEAKLRIKNSIG